MHEENSFVTLTYDDEHLPKGKEVCLRCSTPHVVGGSVCVADFQDFMKRLRKSEPKKKFDFYTVASMVTLRNDLIITPCCSTMRLLMRECGRRDKELGFLYQIGCRSCGRSVFLRLEM